MQKIIVYMASIIMVCSNISNCAQQPQISDRKIPEGQLYAWSYKKKCVTPRNTSSPALIDIATKLNGPRKSGSIQKHGDNWYVADTQTEELLLIENINPKALFKLSRTRMHGQSAGNVGAIDDKGNVYCIESFARSKLGLPPKKEIIISDVKPLDQENIYSNATLQITSQGYWNSIQYEENEHQQEKFFSGHTMSFSEDQMRFLQDQQSSNRISYITMRNQLYIKKRDIHLFFVLKQLQENGIISQDIISNFAKILVQYLPYLKDNIPYLGKKTTFEIVCIKGIPHNLNTHSPLDLHVTVLPAKEQNTLEDFTLYENAHLENSGYSWTIYYKKEGKAAYDQISNPITINQQTSTPFFLVDKNKEIAYQIMFITNKKEAPVINSTKYSKSGIMKYIGVIGAFCGLMYIVSQSYDQIMETNWIVAAFNRLFGSHIDTKM